MAKKKKISAIPARLAPPKRELVKWREKAKVEFVLMAVIDGLPETCPGCDREGNFKRLEFGLWCPTCGTLALLNSADKGVDCWIPRREIDK